MMTLAMRDYGTATEYLDHNQTIDIQGIVKATRLAMKTAVEQLATPPESLLIDYLRLPELSLPQQGIKFGDRLCFSIA